MKVVLLGPPGAGKGTQAARIAEHLNVPSVASGDLFRDHQKRDTELGRLARSYMQRGVLVPDEVTIGMVTEWIEIEAGDGGFLLDGFPRTLGQAEALDGALSNADGLDCVLYIRVSNDELVRRLTGRLVCRGCGVTFHKVSNPPAADGECGLCCDGELYEREDDRPEAVGKRLEVYFSETAPLIGYYREAGILREVDGEQSIEDVGRELVEKLGAAS
jgi:adenylate kinase